jgi:GDP-L-fucose synthase
MYKKSRIYIAGHTGLLGSAIFRCLTARGHTGIIIRESRDLDLTRQGDVDDFFVREKPEYVFLAAGLTGGIEANRTLGATFLHTNLAIQDNVFQAAISAQVKGLIFYGSSCMYPKDCAQPVKEDYIFTGKLEETSLGYAAAKIAGTVACRVYNQQFSRTRFIALVPPTLYGPGDDFDPVRSHVLSGMIAKFHAARAQNRSSVTLWGSGNPRREFLYCDDAADASVFAMTAADKLENRHYNIGSGIDVSIRELSCTVAQIVGYEGEVIWDSQRPDGAARKLLDSGDFMRLGWKSFTALQDGVRKTYDWYRNQTCP